MASLEMAAAMEERRAKMYRRQVIQAAKLVRKRRGGEEKLAHLIARISDMCRVSTNDVRKELGLE